MSLSVFFHVCWFESHLLRDFLSFVSLTFPRVPESHFGSNSSLFFVDAGMLHFPDLALTPTFFLLADPVFCEAFHCGLCFIEIFTSYTCFFFLICFLCCCFNLNVLTECLSHILNFPFYITSILIQALNRFLSGFICLFLGFLSLLIFIRRPLNNVFEISTISYL